MVIHQRKGKLWPLCDLEICVTVKVGHRSPSRKLQTLKTLRPRALNHAQGTTTLEFRDP